MLPTNPSKQRLESEGRSITSTSDQPRSDYEVIDSAELAKRWSLPESWVREQTRCRAADPLPCIRFGKYVRFRWQSPELQQWLSRRCSNGKKG
jgi:hypothetical protein